MSERLSGQKYAKVKVVLLRNEGLPSRVSFEWEEKNSVMGNAERAILALFKEGLHNLCDTCRQAMREMRIAHDTAKGCPRRRSDGLCRDNSHPCGMNCRRIADAINEYRKGMTDGGQP